MAGIGAVVVGLMAVVIGLVIHYVREVNMICRLQEEWRKAEKWNWD